MHVILNIGCDTGAIEPLVELLAGGTVSSLTEQAALTVQALAVYQHQHASPKVSQRCNSNENNNTAYFE
jgi:hypothetical protein